MYLQKLSIDNLKETMSWRTLLLGEMTELVYVKYIDFEFELVL